MSYKKLDMLSVIPGRYDVWRASVLFSPLRYFWQLLLASKKRLPVSSSIWIINRQILLEKLGGFASFKDEVRPEASIAFQLSGSYACFVSNSTLGVSYEKKWRSQAETSRRLLYPMSGGIWWKAAGALIILFFLNVPALMLFSGLFIGWTEIQVMGLWFLFVHMGLYGVYTSYVWRHNWWLGALLWPVVIMQELVLYITSVVGYARHTITWKGRSLAASTRNDRVVIDE